ncbi:hypothetical protein KHA80_07415 [Anaerobacillus sp. HL2]|nr:hypothetical protein KHA80_07415 [Anaerobacillus sp. HL2]
MNEAQLCILNATNTKTGSFGKGNPNLRQKGKVLNGIMVYMTVSFFDKEGMIKFEYKNITGYVTEVNGYKYGYPFKLVE